MNRYFVTYATDYQRIIFRPLHFWSLLFCFFLCFLCFFLFFWLKKKERERERETSASCVSCQSGSEGVCWSSLLFVVPSFLPSFLRSFVYLSTKHICVSLPSRVLMIHPTKLTQVKLLFSFSLENSGAKSHKSPIPFHSIPFRDDARGAAMGIIIT